MGGRLEGCGRGERAYGDVEVLELWEDASRCQDSSCLELGRW